MTALFFTGAQNLHLAPRNKKNSEKTNTDFVLYSSPKDEARALAQKEIQRGLLKDADYNAHQDTLEGKTKVITTNSEMKSISFYQEKSKQENSKEDEDIFSSTSPQDACCFQ